MLRSILLLLFVITVFDVAHAVAPRPHAPERTQLDRAQRTTLQKEQAKLQQKIAKKRAKWARKAAKEGRQQNARDLEITNETLLWIALGVGILLVLALLGLGGVVSTLLYILLVVALVVALVLLVLYLTQQ